MTDNVETMMFVGDTPWHGKGTPVLEAQTAEEAIRAAGLDWEVQRRALFTSEGHVCEVESHRAIVRTSDDQVLGVVGKGYTPLQNREAFRFFDAIVQEGSAIYHTAGSLDGGKRIWILAQLPGRIQVKADTVGKFLLLANGHDGTLAVRARFTPIRVVCANTLASALEGATPEVRIIHRIGIANAVQQAHRALGIASEVAIQNEARYELLASREANTEKVTDFLDTMLPRLPEGAQHAAADKPRGRVLELFEGGARGSDLAGRTVWGLYNAFVEYIDYEQGGNDNRLKSAWMGRGMQRKQDAFMTAMSLAA